MTPPLTDAELLAYIERTTGLKVLILTMLPFGMPLVDRYGKMLWRVRSIAYEFYAHEQLVRGEMQAKIDALMLEYCPDEMTPEQVAEWGRHQKRVPEPTAPQLSTADVSTAPSPEGAGQGEAAEAVGLLQAVKKDLEDRAEDGVVELSSNVWQRLCDFLAKQGGK